MTTWIQNADFSAKDIDHLANFSAFETFFLNFDFSKLDATMLELQQAQQENCPWGIGVNMDTDYGFHLCREDPATNTYSLTVIDITKTKMLGFIPKSEDNGYTKEGLDQETALTEVAKYYDALQSR